MDNGRTIAKQSKRRVKRDLGVHALHLSLKVVQTTSGEVRRSEGTAAHGFAEAHRKGCLLGFAQRSSSRSTRILNSSVSLEED